MTRNISSQNASFDFYLTENITLRLHVQAVNRLDSISIIRELKDKKNSGHDDIYNKLLTLIYPVFFKPPVLIINQSLTIWIT